MVNKDTLWKGIIEDLVEEFVRYFFSRFVDLIDFEKGFTFLDKELEKLFPQAESKRRHADKLIRAYLKDGNEQWFLVHVEVQGYSDPEFAIRMFQYAYRIRDRYNRPLTALAIYTDTDRQHHFSEYRETFFETEFIYRFQTFILIDQEPKKLRRADNPFGLVMEVARRNLDLLNKDDGQRLSIKIKLVRHLLQQKVSKRKIRVLLNFIKYYTHFRQSDYFYKFEKELRQLTKSREAMGIEEAILQEFKEKGLEEGRKQGRKQGLEEGLEQGIEQGIEEKERIVIKRAWKKGMPVDEIADLVDISVEKVEAIIEELTGTP